MSEAEQVSSSRKKLRRGVITVAAIAFALVLADALGFFDTENYVKITHGNHSHYVAKDRADGIAAGDCPQRAPDADEYITPQCQMVRMINVDGVVHYVPEGYNPNLQVQQFPTRRPGPEEIITPNGQIQIAEGHDHE